MAGRQTNSGKSSNRSNTSKSTTAKRNTSSSNNNAKAGMTKKNTGSRVATKSSSSKATRSKSTAGSARNTAKRNQRSQVQDEITVLLVLACAIILMLSNFDLAGSIGQAIKWFMFGLIGVVAYVFPIILAFTIIFLVSNRNIIAVARIKSCAIIILSVMLAAGWQRIADNPVIEDTQISEFFTYCADEKCGGGFFGGIICKALSSLGFWGSMVVIVIISIIAIVIITEKSFIKSIINVKNSSSEFVKNAKLDYDEYKEHSKQRFEENDERARERKEAKIKRKEEQRLRKEQEAAQIKQNEEKAKERMNKKALGVTKDTVLSRDDIQGGKIPEAGTFEGKLPIGSTIDIREIVVDTERVDQYTKDIYIPDKESISDTTVYSESEYDNNKYSEPEYSELKFSESEYSGPKHSDSKYEQSKNNEPEYERAKDYDMEYEEPEYTTLDTQSDSVDAKQDNSFAKDVVNKKVLDEKNENYVFPPLSLLSKGSKTQLGGQNSGNRETALRLQQTLQNFGVKVTITDISCGPTVTRYELQPEMGVKVSKIVALADDIKLNLAAADIRIEAPIPGKSAVGIEVPNKEAGSVGLRELLESDSFKGNPSAITFAAGKDIAGKIIVGDIAKMPHMLIAGATGSGKSVCINTIIMSILYKAHPDDVKLIMVDPKVVELSVYNGIPHLLTPVVTDPKKAAGALNWAVAEMTDRYKKFAQMTVRDLKGYNEKIAKMEVQEGEEIPKKLPQIVIIIDELADLMMVAAKEVEDAICRLAQLARACGIHLIIATQRPSAQVITGLIKANVPSKIAFSVASGIDSRIILDMNGAEKLLGRGDMLFFPSGYPKPVRVQGAFVSDEEVSKVVEFLKGQVKEDIVYNEEITNTVVSAAGVEKIAEDEKDPYFAEAARFVVEKEKASIGMLQRYYKIGFNRAGRIVDQLADAGIVGPEVGTKPRKILMSMEEVEAYLKNI